MTGYGNSVIVRSVLSLGQIVAWCHEIDPAARIGLNVLLTDGDRLVGSRWGRTLHYVERWGVHDCEICGFPHIRHDPRHSYRAVVIASEPISHEPWRELPDGCVFAVTTRMALQINSAGELPVNRSSQRERPRRVNVSTR